jgi:hypothetical protein
MILLQLLLDPIARAFALSISFTPYVTVIVVYLYNYGDPRLFAIDRRRESCCQSILDRPARDAPSPLTCCFRHLLVAVRVRPRAT